ncbi:hypothetical protein QN277_009673 [Acacia crassicarpa]|uniref:Disease resistance protein At4g27190-like leucine-rich repeats domain-containing protein n=1 Tax=Acacia crassicarpa TaxID=499986 RepID=A0AAE1JJD9_9FABA|nr:hypothetical protein QN277_009673 [Acacia crassicarpa]
MDSSSTLKENIKYSRWNIVDFPSHFDSRKLEVLLLWISNNADSPTIKVPNGIFEGMKNLKFLAIMNWSNIEISCAPLFQSLPSLINIQSLAIKRFELGDISLLGNLKSLESLELSHCSMIELPKEIGELEKLRLLEMVRCDIERNNPFEVIGSCSQLEELYFVSNRMDEDNCESLAQISTFPKLERYHIKARHGFSSYKVDFSISRYFNLEYLRVSFSDEIFKSLAARAEVLKFGRDYDNRGWTNVVPDILPVKDDNMEDPLTRLCLQSMNGITCLIRTERLQLDAGIFSMLVELKLSDIHVRELCCGPYPVDFLKQLEKLHLSRCKNLEGLLFAGKLELCNLKSIHLQECSMACLFQPFTAQSLKQLEMLHIDKCSGLNYIVAKPMEDHDPNQTSHESMLPKLKYLKVRSCPELEFILPIYFCKDLPLLESMEIASCEKLEYILGQYPYERDLHQMGKEAILQSLEELEISRVPNFINLYAEWYLPCPSDKIQKSSPSTDVEGCTSSSSRGHLCCFWPKSNASTIHHPSAFTNHNEEMGKQEFTCLYAIKASKAELDSSAARGFFPAALYQFKLRKFMLTGFSQLTSLFTISIASSLKLLETLKVEECEALQHIITVERPTSHGRQMIVHSPFPRLKEVCIRRCNSLEYVFPAFYSKHFQHLERLSIREAGKMKYVFGKCPADQDHNVHSELALPALKELCLADVLNMVSICAENYYVEVLHLDQIDCEGCPQLPQTLIDFLFGGHNRQDLSRRKALSFKERGKPLSNLRELCDSRDRYVEPKNFLSFQKLSWLRFVGCKQLQFILSVSTAISMPELRNLIISDCEELVSIIEDDKENQQNPFDPHHETCFPKLFRIEVKQCKKLKCLFSISTYPKLPRLRTLEIEDAPELVQVFEWKQGASQELVIKDVLPNLLGIRLVNLPSLHTIYQGIDIQTLKFRLVRNSGNIPSTNVSSSELFDSLASLHPDQMNFVGIEFFRTYNIIWKWARQRRSEEESEKALERDKTISEQNNNTLNLEDSEEASKEADEKDSAIQKQESSSQNLTEVEEEESQKDIGNDSIMPQQNNASPDFEKSKEVSKEIVKNDSTTHKQNSNLSNLTENAETSKNEIVEEQLPASNAAATPSSKSNRSEELSKEITAEDSTTNINLPNLTKSTKTSANEIVEEKLSTTPSSDFNMNLKETFGEGPSSEKCGKSHGKESMDDDQQAHGESRSSNEGLQRIEEPTKEWSSKKTSNEVSLKIPPPLVTEMTSPLDPSIITLKKPPTAISTTQTEPKSSQSDMFDISINTECPQVEIMTNDKTCTDVEEMKFDQKSSSQIFEEHDLMRLFQMMKEGADMEVDLSYVSKLITDLHHNKEVTKALADLEASLKKGLNEIACSKESRIRLQNALNILSSHCSEGGASSHGLQDTIQSLQEEIQTVLSSFNQAYATIDKFTKLEQREKLMIEQRSQREKDAKTLLYDINTTKNSIAEVQLNEAELKEQISKLQAELRNKEEEIEEYERKLLSLQKQEKKSVSDTIGFTMEFMAMEKERSRMVEDQMKARQQLENMDAKWSSCLSNLKKTMILLGVHLKQKL